MIKSIVQSYHDSKWEQLRVIKLLSDVDQVMSYISRLGNKRYLLRISQTSNDALKPKKGWSWKELQFLSNIPEGIIGSPLIDYKIISHNERVCRNIMLPPYHHSVVTVQLYIPCIPLQSHLDTIIKPTLPNGLVKPHIPLKFTKEFTERSFYRIFLATLNQVSILHSHGYAHNNIAAENIMILSNGDVMLTDYKYISYKTQGKLNIDSDIYAIYKLSHLENHASEHNRLCELFGDKEHPMGANAGNRDVKIMLSNKDKKVREVIVLCKNVPEKYKKKITFNMMEMLMPDIVKQLTFPKHASDAFWTELWLIDKKFVITLINSFKKGLSPIIEIMS